MQFKLSHVLSPVPAAGPSSYICRSSIISSIKSGPSLLLNLPISSLRIWLSILSFFLHFLVWSFWIVSHTISVVLLSVLNYLTLTYCSLFALHWSCSSVFLLARLCFELFLPACLLGLASRCFIILLGLCWLIGLLGWMVCWLTWLGVFGWLFSACLALFLNRYMEWLTCFVFLFSPSVNSFDSILVHMCFLSCLRITIATGWGMLRVFGALSISSLPSCLSFELWTGFYYSKGHLERKNRAGANETTSCRNAVKSTKFEWGGACHESCSK